MLIEKIGELEQHCGECKLIDFCAEPYEELCICTDIELSHVNVSAYFDFAMKHRYLNNKEIHKSFSSSLEA